MRILTIFTCLVMFAADAAACGGGIFGRRAARRQVAAEVHTTAVGIRSCAGGCVNAIGAANCQSYACPVNGGIGNCPCVNPAAVPTPDALPPLPAGWKWSCIGGTCRPVPVDANPLHQGTRKP